MIGIFSPSNDPYFNLAAEEFLFKNLEQDLIFVYINQPAIVLGKHQNAWKEVNFKYVTENNIPVIRRLTGGGTVFHDLGNLNFSFHRKVDDPATTRFGEFKKPVLKFLQTIVAETELNSRNDLVIGDRKISGNAEHVFRKKVLSHGTLLINADLNMLSEGLKVTPEKFTDKAVKSVRSKVANLANYTNLKVDMEQLGTDMISYILKENEPNEIKHFSPDQIKNIEKLAEEKYKDWNWNFAYSPKFIFTNEINHLNKEKTGCILSVEKGIIAEINIYSTLFDDLELVEITNTLDQHTYRIDEIINTISQLGIQNNPDRNKILIDCLFNL